MKTFQTFDISAEYDAIHRTFPCHKDAPVIGLTGNFQEGACTWLATDRRCGYQSLVPWRRTDKGITQYKSPEGSSGVIACQTGRRPADTDSGNMPRHTGDERRFWRQPVSGYPRTDGRGTDQTRSGFGTGICLAYGPDRERFLTL